jgi:hypothetical protein
VHPPEVGQPGRVDALASFGRSPKGVSGLAEIVLKEPSLCEGTANLQLFVALEGGPFQCPNEQVGSVGAASLLECQDGLTIEILRWHGATVYLVYTRIS